jgi:hypothetical protein
MRVAACSGVSARACGCSQAIALHQWTQLDTLSLNEQRESADGRVLFVFYLAGVILFKEVKRMPEKYVVAWDFAKKPSGTFYRVLNDEFGNSRSHGVFTLIQRSVALCRDDFTASRLAALATFYGATVASFAIAHEGFDRAAEQEANAYVERIHMQRLHQRGRRPSTKSKSRQ